MPMMLRSLALFFLALCAFSVQAQSTTPRIHRIGFLSPLPANPPPSTLIAFRERMRELGYVEGRNLVIEARFAEGRHDRLPGIAAELLGLKVEVLVVGSEVGVMAAQKATTTVPIVFAGVIDPVAAGIVRNLSRPGGNVTGATFGIGGLGFAGKWVELLREIDPSISHIAVLSNLADPSSEPLIKEINAAARALKVRISQFDAGDDAALERAFAAIGASGATGMIVTSASYFGSVRTKLVQFAGEKRLRAMYFLKLFADSGGLISYGGSLPDTYIRAANYVDRIIKGAKPGDLPIDQPTRIELVINLKAAKAIGLTVPRGLVFRADHVIE